MKKGIIILMLTKYWQGKKKGFLKIKIIVGYVIRLIFIFYFNFS